MKSIMLSVLITAGLAASAQQPLPAPVQAAQAAVSAGSIRAYDKFLADDLLEGRYPGQRGGQLAAQYIASQFESFGLAPAGDNGTYFQQVDFTSVKADASQTTFTITPEKGAPMTLRYAEDFVVFNQQLTPKATIHAPIVWVGYGITAPEFQWNDYAGTDVKGKVILCLVNDPPSDDPTFFGGKALTYYGRWTYKFEQAARMGAVGALIIHRTDLAAYGWDVVRNSNSSEKTFLAHDANPRLEAAAWVQLAVAEKIFNASGTTFEKEFAAAGARGFHARALPLMLDATVVSSVRSFQSPNVLAVLARAQKSGPDQAVIYTAHYDHLGVKTDAKPGEDAIFNGAGDNGTGTAMILEMARTLAAAHVVPPHSIYFAAVTAEEQGLLGSAYLAQHPPLPIAQLNLDLNFDEILPFGQGTTLSAGGAQRTTFFPALEATAKEFGYTIPAPRPDTGGGYYRSDHFSFAHAGVPAFSLNQGGIFKGHDEAWSRKQGADYNRNDYHNVTDNFRPEWDFSGNATLCRLGIALGWQAVAGPEIAWHAGDKFEAARKASR